MAHRPGAAASARRRSTRFAPRSPCSTRRSSRTLPLVYREVDRALDPEGAACGPSVPAVPAVGHVGRRRPRRQPAVTAEVTPRPRAIATDHVLRGSRDARRAASPGRSRCSDATSRPRPRAAADRSSRDERSFPAPRRRARAHAPRRAPPPQARAGGPAPRRDARHAARGAYDGPAAFRRDLDVLQRVARRGWRAGPRVGRARSTCAGRPRRSASTWPRWRCASTRRSSTRRCASSRRERRGRAALDRLARARRSTREATTAETREVLATFRAIRDVQDRLGARPASA